MSADILAADVPAANVPVADKWKMPIDKNWLLSAF